MRSSSVITMASAMVPISTGCGERERRVSGSTTTRPTTQLTQRGGGDAGDERDREAGAGEAPEAHHHAGGDQHIDAAGHRDLAEGEVDAPDQAVDQGETGGDQAIYAGERQPVQRLLQPIGRPHREREGRRALNDRGGVGEPPAFQDEELDVAQGAGCRCRRRRGRSGPRRSGRRSCRSANAGG